MSSRADTGGCSVSESAVDLSQDGLPEPSKALQRHRCRKAARHARWRGRWVALRGQGGLRLLAAIAGGVMLYLGYAPATLWMFPMIGLALLAIALAGRGWKSGAGLGLAFGAAWYVPLISWTGIYVGAVPWLALAITESVLVMPAAALIAVASRLVGNRLLWPVIAACLWVASEVLHAYVPFGGFPWGSVAFTQTDGPLLPLAAVTGESGLSFAVALSGFALGVLCLRCWTWSRARLHPSEVAHDGALGAAPSPPRTSHRIVPLLSAALLAAVPLLAGQASLVAVTSTADAPTAPIAVIQGNVPEPGLEFNARRRAVLDMHAAETERLAAAVAAGKAQQPAAVIWPENSSDIDPYRNADAAEVIDRAARAIGVPILVGAVVLAGDAGQHDGTGGRIGHVYNQGIVWDPVTGPGATYTKREPVPFAEYMPYRSFFRFFSSKVDLVTADFLPGDKPGNLDVGGIAVGDVICFEVVNEGLVRDVVNGGAQVIVVQTNNATFGYTDETYQQQAMGRLRAVEFGRTVLISATSGVSAVIRPDGSVESSIGLFQAGYLLPTVPLLTATTPGTVVGEPLRWVLAALGPLALLWQAWWLRRRAGDIPDETGERTVDSA